MIGKVALVTGAASGIGKAAAQRLAAGGAQTVLADLDKPAAQQVAKAICETGGQAFAVELDVASESQWEAVIARITTNGGKLNICVNCAGISFSKPMTETSHSEWQRVMSVNLDGVFLGTRYAMKAMQSQREGCIINIASAAGLKPLSGNAAYGTSKAAVRFLTRIASIEGAAHQIRVNSISPGAIATPMWEGTDWWPRQIAEQQGRDAALKALVSTQGFGRPEEIAAVVEFLASDESRLITGVDLPVDAGFSAA
jgi:NAD(P)-dependent dehydrogenase (short-subunit alcohol dehydrogenase family)